MSIQSQLASGARGEYAIRSQLVRTVRDAGDGAVAGVYGCAFLLSLIVVAAAGFGMTVKSTVLNLLLWVLWIAVGCLFIAVGTRISHVFALWGIAAVSVAVACSGVVTSLMGLTTVNALGGFTWPGTPSVGALVGSLLLNIVLAVGSTVVAVGMYRGMRQLESSSQVNMPLPGPVPTGSDMASPFAPPPPSPAPQSPAASPNFVKGAQPNGVGTQPTTGPIQNVSANPSPFAPPPKFPTRRPPNPYGVRGGRRSTPPRWAPTSTGPTSTYTGSSLSAAPGAPYAGPPRYNALAIPALLAGVLFAPLGIVIGHLSLAQIRRSGEAGSGFAMAGLIIGYLLTGLSVLMIVGWFVMLNSLNQTFADLGVSDTTETTETTTSPSWYSGYSNSIDDAIVTSDVGACLYKESSGSTITTLYRVDCSSSSANYRVTMRTDTTSDCGNDWVQTVLSGNRVVLCLVDE